VPTSLIKLVAAGAGAAAAVAARRAAESGWRRYRGQEPPAASDGVSNATDLRDLMAWPALLIVSVLVARKLASDGTQKLLRSAPA
jgi:hypothetical protein